MTSPYFDAVVADGPAVLWKLDEVTGTTAADSGTVQADGLVAQNLASVAGYLGGQRQAQNFMPRVDLQVNKLTLNVSNYSNSSVVRLGLSEVFPNSNAALPWLTVNGTPAWVDIPVGQAAPGETTWSLPVTVPLAAMTQYRYVVLDHSYTSYGDTGFSATNMAVQDMIYGYNSGTTSFGGYYETGGYHMPFKMYGPLPSSGTYTGAVTKGAGPLVAGGKWSPDFDGGHVATSATQASWAAGTSGVLSIETVLQADSLPASGQRRWITTKGNINSYEYGLFITSAGAISATFWTAAGENVVSVSTADGVVRTDGVPQHVVVTFDRAAQTARIYLNGTLANEVTTGFNGLVVTGSSPVQIARRADAGEETWRGRLQGVAIYNKVLTATQVATHAAAFPGGAPLAGAGSAPRDVRTAVNTEVGLYPEILAVPAGTPVAARTRGGTASPVLVNYLSTSGLAARPARLTATNQRIYLPPIITGGTAKRVRSSIAVAEIGYATETIYGGHFTFSVSEIFHVAPPPVPFEPPPPPYPQVDTPVGTPNPGKPMPAVQKWLFQDYRTSPMTKYTFPINPREQSSPHAARNISDKLTTAGRAISVEGARMPVEWEFGGFIKDKAMYLELKKWSEKKYHIWVSNDIGQRYEVYITSFEAVPHRPNQVTDKHVGTYTIKCFVFEPQNPLLETPGGWNNL